RRVGRARSATVSGFDALGVIHLIAVTRPNVLVNLLNCLPVGVPANSGLKWPQHCKGSIVFGRVRYAAFHVQCLHQPFAFGSGARSEEHTSELQSRENLVCRLLLEKKKLKKATVSRK